MLTPSARRGPGQKEQGPGLRHGLGQRHRRNPPPRTRGRRRSASAALGPLAAAAPQHPRHHHGSPPPPPTEQDARSGPSNVMSMTTGPSVADSSRQADAGLGRALEAGHHMAPEGEGKGEDRHTVARQGLAGHGRTTSGLTLAPCGQAGEAAANPPDGRPRPGCRGDDGQRPGLDRGASTPGAPIYAGRGAGAALTDLPTGLSVLAGNTDTHAQPTLRRAFNNEVARERRRSRRRVKDEEPGKAWRLPGSIGADRGGRLEGFCWKPAAGVFPPRRDSFREAGEDAGQDTEFIRRQSDRVRRVK